MTGQAVFQIIEIDQAEIRAIKAMAVQRCDKRRVFGMKPQDSQVQKGCIAIHSSRPGKTLKQA